MELHEQEEQAEKPTGGLEIMGYGNSPNERTTLEGNERGTFTPAKDGIEYKDPETSRTTLAQNERMTFTPELDAERDATQHDANQQNGADGTAEGRHADLLDTEGPE